MQMIVAEFLGLHYSTENHTMSNEKWCMTGDVKDHLDMSMYRSYPDGRKIHLCLVPNPSNV